MSQLAGTGFGIGTPYPLTQSPWGFSPYAGQGFGGQAFPQQSYGPILSNPFVGGNFGSMPYGIGTVSPLPSASTWPAASSGVRSIRSHSWIVQNAVEVAGL